MDYPRIISDPMYSVYQSRIEKEVRGYDMPQHIAVIMDGNRRYAKEVLMTEDTNKGHEMGKSKLREVLDWCIDLGIRYLTVYAFSMENFKREDSEVEFLMRSLASALTEFANDERIHQYQVSIRVIGDCSLLPDYVLKAMDFALEKTKGYDRYHLNLAIAYSGRHDITTAVRGIVKDVMDGKLDIDDIDENVFGKYVSTFGLPDPDLVMRTSGEVRISNFLLWQMAYSELYFIDVYWPGFRYIDLLRAIRTYQQRHRRYGK
ncbi:MAG: di-trans,poly-cis-decaprenylcistransferase [Candidatus Methanomethylophilaceae archaeon]|nr:di-trans,poly-cis-decaprenylcistransferase [Candidatus Methanomethylophilaceae archaeon]